MGQNQDYFRLKAVPVMKKRSTRGRKKNWVFRLNVGDSFSILPPEQVASMAGVSPKTVYHWIAGTKTPSPQVQQLMEIKGGGLFPWRGWEGWRMLPETGRLVAPNGYSFMAGELAWWSLEKALRSELQKENAALRVQVATLTAQIQEQHADNLLTFPRRHIIRR